MDVQQVIRTASETASVKRAFGEAYQQGGVTIIPVARVSGGGGVGGGNGPNDQGQGEGSGFGVGISPSGVFVVRGEHIEWRPAVDVNRLVASCLIAGVMTLFAVRAIVRAFREAG